VNCFFVRAAAPVFGFADDVDFDEARFARFAGADAGLRLAGTEEISVGGMRAASPASGDTAAAR
jgi:hypothetical protein